MSLKYEPASEPLHISEIPAHDPQTLHPRVPEQVQQNPVLSVLYRLVFYCRTTSASTAPRTPRRTCCPSAYVLITVLRVSRSCELFPDGFDIHLLQLTVLHMAEQVQEIKFENNRITEELERVKRQLSKVSAMPFLGLLVCCPRKHSDNAKR